MTSNSRYSMLDSMDIRCARCGYENKPQFRFCGMCGAALRPRDPEHREVHAEAMKSEGEIISQRLMENAPAPPEPMPVEPLIAELAAAQKRQAESARTYSRESRDESHSAEAFHGQRTAVPVTGLSFLGLSDSGEDRRVEYLLEDEPHPGRTRAVLVFALLLAIAAGGILYWRKAGYPWPSQANTNSTAASAPISSNTSGGNAKPEPQVAAPKERDEIAEKPEASEKSLSDDGSNANHANSAMATEPGDQTNVEGKVSGDEPPDTKTKSEKTEPSDVLPAQPAQKAAPTHTAELRKPKPSNPAAAAADIPNPAEDSLFLQGQKYLYGSGGVSSNCARAEQYLTTSANSNNSKAQSTLGTMYATGHCVHRDLPLAYHWFARALHEDPRNTRLERDVQIMWDQMSPQERNAALKNE